MHSFEPLAGLLLAYLALMAAARRLPIAPPVTLVFGGLALSFVPGLPHLALDPGLVLLVFLPPVLFWEATLVSWREVRPHLRPIAWLAVGLVLATMGAVAVVAHALLPGLPWAAAFVLGAVVSPTDPVALLAIAQRLPLPRRVVDVLIGESLVNDATALVAYRFALAAAATGSFEAPAAALRFGYVVAGAIAIGLATAWAVLQLRRLASRHTLHDNLDVVLIPFLAYLAAELGGTSGVLAVVASGLYVGWRLPALMSAHARLQGGATWEMAVFALNGMLFVLIGLQLQAILAAPRALPLGALLAIGAVLTAVVILTRLLSMAPAILLARAAAATGRGPAEPWPLAHVGLLGWTGMRGGVSLAAALGIPVLLADGTPFPGRSEIIVLTSVVLLGTLGLQGLTLPALIRRMGPGGDEDLAREEAKARLEIARAALRRLDELALEREVPVEVLDRLRAPHLARAARLQDRPDPGLEARDELLGELRALVLGAERRALAALHDRGAISERVRRRLQAELDHDVVRAAHRSM